MDTYCVPENDITFKYHMNGNGNLLQAYSIIISGDFSHKIYIVPNVLTKLIIPYESVHVMSNNLYSIKYVQNELSA